MTAPPEVRAAIRADYEAGDTCREIGARYGHHYKTVHRWLREEGVPMRPASRRFAVAAEVREAAVADYAAGEETLEAVAARYGVSQSALHRWVQKASACPRDPFALTGGRWVFSPARRVQVWEAS